MHTLLWEQSWDKRAEQDQHSWGELLSERLDERRLGETNRSHLLRYANTIHVTTSLRNHSAMDYLDNKTNKNKHFDHLSTFCYETKCCVCLKSMGFYTTWWLPKKHRLIFFRLSTKNRRLFGAPYDCNLDCRTHPVEVCFGDFDWFESARFTDSQFKKQCLLLDKVLKWNSKYLSWLSKTFIQ